MHECAICGLVSTEAPCPACGDDEALNRVDEYESEPNPAGETQLPFGLDSEPQSESTDLPFGLEDTPESEESEPLVFGIESSPSQDNQDSILFGLDESPSTEGQ